MLPEIGQLALVLAALLALVQGSLPLLGAARADARLQAVAVPAAAGQFACVAIAFALLAWSFATNDFSVRNVAHNSFSALPLTYRLTATWGSHEGSLLLWVLIMAGWGALVPVLGRGLQAALVARVLGVMGLLGLGFLAFLLLTSNPFVRLYPVPADGADLNPLLQDWGMILHPPLLYLGYVGFGVTFAFAVAALLDGAPDATWARRVRPWAGAAWVFLTIGIALGSWWAYRELGWGGWWFWDPTENASLMPWLAGTALLHSLAVTARRGQLAAWSLLLAIATFALSLLGTFLVRSGMLSSVHAFAADPARGLFILALLALAVGGSLALYAARAPRRAPAAPLDWPSREAFLLGQNLLLMVALGTVLLGTLYPLLLDVLGLARVSVGPPYFNSVLVPVAAPLLFLAAIGPVARWRDAPLPALASRLRWAFGSALALALLLPLAVGGPRPGATLGLFLGLFILGSMAVALAERRGPLPRRALGMHVAHAGLAVLVLGITLVSHYALERDVRLASGESADLGRLTFTFHGTTPVQGPNWVGDRGAVSVALGNGRSAWLYPEKRRYQVSGIAVTEAALHSTPWRDLYVSLGQFIGNDADGRQVWSLRLYRKPFIGWLWARGALLALGGALAASAPAHGRRRSATLSLPAALPEPTRSPR